MRARFVSLFFCIYPKTPFSIFTSHKRSQILRKYLCIHSSNWGWTERINYNPYQNIQYMFWKIIIPKTATKYYKSSTMANEIVRAHKLGKKRKQPESTADSSNTPSTTSNFNELIKKTMISQVKNHWMQRQIILQPPLYTINLLVLFKLHLYLLHTKNTTITNISVDDDAQSFEAPENTITVSLHQVPRFC